MFEPEIKKTRVQNSRVLNTIVSGKSDQDFRCKITNTGPDIGK
jgi:hypothetical protein